MNYSSWYEKNYPALSGYGLWLRGGEPNTLAPEAFDAAECTILIARLSTYRDTADSFTHKLLYQIAAGIPGVYPDLAWLPPPKDAELFDRDGVPWLLGTTSKHGARDFNLLALSLSIVQELLNIAPLLRRSGIPVPGSERRADAASPLVILGGASALHSSYCFGEESPVDGIFVGDDANTIRELFSLCKAGFAGKRHKRDILEDLLSIPGFFLPGGPIETTVFHAPTAYPGQLLERGPILYDEGTIGTASLTISEGCACFCSFCAESFGRKPYREYEVDLLREAALRLKAAMAVEKLELYSFNFSLHRSFYRLLTALAPLFPAIGLKSQRLDSIAHDPGLLKFLHAVGKASLTCGIEGISPRLRRYLHKSLDERELRRGLFALLTSPIRELKLFLIATGLEEQADYDAFRELLALMTEVLQGSQHRPRIIFSMTILVRFPWTPLEFEDAPPPETCGAVLRTVERLTRAAGFEFRASAEVAEYWLSQILVRIADPRVAEAVAAAGEAIDFIYYREIPFALVEAVRQQFALRGIEADVPLRGHRPDNRAGKPWSGIAIGVKEEFLAAQWESAGRSEDRGYRGTLKPGEDSDAKPSPAEPLSRPLPIMRTEPHPSLERFRGHLSENLARKTAVHFRIWVDPPLGNVPVAMRGTMLARALLMADPALVPEYWGNGGSRVAGAQGWERVTGDDIVSLCWLAPADAAVRLRIGDATFCTSVAGFLGEKLTLIGIVEQALENPAVIVFSSPFPFDPAEFCSRKSLKFTLCKTGPFTADYRLSRDSLRKKVWSGCTVEQGRDARHRVTIVPGPRFSPAEFAQTAFKLPEKSDWVRISMVGRFGE
jgi:radical SAM superfamily enzyme YgiQ (UPF0313 family)